MPLKSKGQIALALSVLTAATVGVVVLAINKPPVSASKVAAEQPYPPGYGPSFEEQYGLECASPPPGRNYRLLSVGPPINVDEPTETKPSNPRAAARTAKRNLKGYDSMTEEDDGKVGVFKDGKKIALFLTEKEEDGEYRVSVSYVCPEAEAREDGF